MYQSTATTGKTYTATNYSIDHQKYTDVQFSPGRKIALDIYDPKFYFPSDKAQAPTLQRSDCYGMGGIKV